MEKNFSAFDNEILNPTIKKFIYCTNRITSIFKSLDNPCVIKSKFSELLVYLLPGFKEHFTSCQILADKKLFFSLGLICRSLFDLEITLSWINQLDIEKKDKAIQIYLNFNGKHPETKRDIYEWQKIIDRNFTFRTTVKNLKLDTLLPFIKEEEPIFSFDFLSKIAHWNPEVIRDLVAIDSQNKVAYRQIKLSMLTLFLALKSISMFTLIYVSELFPDKNEETFNLLKEVKEEYLEHISKM